MLLNLPPELLLHIFEYLPIKDTIHLKRVSKKFSHLLSLIQPKSLTILAENEFEKNYGFSSIPLKSNDLIVNNNENLLLSSKLNLIFKNLKKLSTYFHSDTLIELTHFYNQFSGLEKLIIYHRCRIENKIILNLDHLKTFKVILDFGSNFELNTPHLIKVQCEELYNFKFKYPEKIKILEGEFFDNSFVNELEKFTSLEILIISSGEWTLITNTLLQKVPSLKELHFAPYTYVTNEILNQSFDYRISKNLKLYQFGFNILSDVVITDENFPDCKSSEVTKILIRNFDKTANRVYFAFEKLDYVELTKNGRHLLAEKFYEKFPQFFTVKIHGQVVDENDLLDFLMKVEPEALKFEDAKLSRAFFDRLSFQCSFIRELKFKGSNGSIFLKPSNFNFVYKLENLNKIIFWEKIHLGCAIELHEKIKNMCEVTFIIDRLNQINFCLTYVNSLSEFILDDDNDYACLEGCSFFETKQEMLHYLKEKRLQFKSDPIDLRELIFSIHVDNYHKSIAESMINKLFRKETIYLDKSVQKYLEKN